MKNRTLIATFLAGLLVGSAIVVLWAARGESSSSQSGDANKNNASRSVSRDSSSQNKPSIPIPELVRKVERSTNREFKYNPDRLRNHLVPVPEPDANGQELMTHLVNELENKNYRVVVGTRRGKSVHQIVKMPRNSDNRNVVLAVSRGSATLQTAGDSASAQAGDELFVGPDENIYSANSVAMRSAGNKNSRNLGADFEAAGKNQESSPDTLLKKIPILLTVEPLPGREGAFRWRYPGDTTVPLFVNGRYYTGSLRLVEDSKTTKQFDGNQKSWVIDLELKITDQSQTSNENK